MGDTRPRRIEQYFLRELLFVVLMVVVALVQITSAPVIAGFPVPLVLVVVVCQLLVGLDDTVAGVGGDVALRWAFYGGIVLDIGADTPLGSHVLALMLALVLVVLVTRQFRGGRALLPLVAVFIALLVYETVLAIFYHTMVAVVDWRSQGLYIVLPSLLLALIITLPLFHLLRWWATYHD